MRPDARRSTNKEVTPFNHLRPDSAAAGVNVTVSNNSGKLNAWIDFDPVTGVLYFVNDDKNPNSPVIPTLYTIDTGTAVMTPVAQRELRHYGHGRW